MKSLAGSLVSEYKPFTAASITGYLHSPSSANSAGGVVLTHGAGTNCQVPLLLAVAAALAYNGFHVLRCDLAFRQRRPSGPPHPAAAAEDRESLRKAAAAMRQISAGKLILGGHSYGGRQATMLAAEDAAVADALLLLSYPLHPPLKPAALRTEHFLKLAVPSLFVHGTRDPFGTQDEMQTALGLIPAPTVLSLVDGAGHDLARGRFDITQLILNQLPNQIA